MSDDPVLSPDGYYVWSEGAWVPREAWEKRRQATERAQSSAVATQSGGTEAPPTNFCPRCGSPSAGARFCPGCGAVLGGLPIAGVAPSAPLAAPHESLSAGSDTVGQRDLDNSRAWLLAAAPLLSLCLDAALLFGGYAEAAVVSVLIALCVNTAISIWDSRYVRARGFDVSTLLAVLLVPVYLWQRAKKTQQGQALLAGWIVTFVVSVAGSAALASHFAQFDMSLLEQQLQAAVDEQADTSSTVSCPSNGLHAVGSTFLCDVSDASGRGHLEIKVTGSDASYTWQLIG